MKLNQHGKIDLYARFYRPSTKILLIMKLVVVLMIAFSVQISAKSFAQKVTLSLKDASLDEVLSDLHQQTGVLFLYSNKALKDIRGINIDIKKGTLQQTLDQCFSSGSLGYLVKNNTIIIFPKALVNEFVTPVLNVSGTVTDNKGNPLAGVTVRIKNSNLGTITDQDGHFRIGVSDPNALLEFSSIGFDTKDVTVGGKTELNVVMQQSTNGLNQLVVVGYGRQIKRDITGATSTVSSDEIAKRPLVRVEQALQGTTPGVLVESNSGQPGNGLSVRIRGVNSITGSNEPLYVIDGYIGGNIESIDPNDIESIEILKDASATAIYGSRGSNGVVIITTKTGKVGKLQVDFGTWFSKAMIPKELPLMNAYDFARAVNAQYATTGQPPGFTQAQLDAFKNNPGTDWQKALQQKPWIQNYDLSLSGGAAAVNYRFSFNYLDQPGLIINQYYKRATLRSNVGVRLNRKIDLQLNIAAVMPQNRNTGFQGDISDPFAEAIQFDPTLPVRDSNGNYNLRSQFGSDNLNPVAQEASQEVDGNSTDITGSGILTYHILDNLTFTSQNFYEINWNEQQTVYGFNTIQYQVGNDYAATNFGKGRNFQNSNFLTYDGHWGNHSLTVTAVYEQANSIGSNVNSRSNNLSTYSLGYWNLGLGSTQVISSGYTNSALQSYVGRVNYSYKNKYLLTASIRDDGSSHLTKKYSTFPSVGVAWNISKEKFLENSRLINNLKLRGSWGITGNQAVGAYATIPTIGTGGIENATAYYYDGTTPSRYTPLQTPVSSSLKWEDDQQTDVGLDATLFSNLVNFTIDAYHKLVTNLLYNLTAPQYLGGGTYETNLGSLENDGIEFGIGVSPIKIGGVTWSTYYNMSFNRNKVLSLGTLNNVVVNNIGSAETGVSLLKVGEPLGEFYGYKFLGTWKTGQKALAATYGNVPGDSRYEDVNNDGIINQGDEGPIGNGTPKYTFGFINDINYNNFTLSFMFQGAGGNQIYSFTIPYTMGGLGDARNATNKAILNVWTPSNQTNIPTFSPSSQNYINSSRYVYNGNYIKLKNLSLTYNFPENLLSNLKVRELQVYVSGQNIFCITKFPGYDPEVSNATNGMTQGLETGVIPNPKTYTIGLRVGF